MCWPVCPVPTIVHYRYKILAPAEVDKAAGDPKKAAEAVLDAAGLDADQFRLGHTKARLRYIIRWNSTSRILSWMCFLRFSLFFLCLLIINRNLTRAARHPFMWYFLQSPRFFEVFFYSSLEESQLLDESIKGTKTSPMIYAIYVYPWKPVQWIIYTYIYSVFFFLLSLYLTLSVFVFSFPNVNQKKKPHIQRRYKILCANAIKDNCEPKKAAELILDAINLEPEQYRMGHTKV